MNCDKDEQQSDIDWCLSRTDNLSLELFATHFNYHDKRLANNRYVDILNSHAFKNCSKQKQIIDAFKSWKGSAEEKLFWAEKGVEIQKTVSQTVLTADGMRTAEQYGLKGGCILRGSVGDVDSTEGHGGSISSSGENERVGSQAKHADVSNIGTKRSGDPLPDSRAKRVKTKKDKADTPIHLDEFEQVFQSMTGPKWKLNCSGRYVENILYHYGKGLEKEHLCHSFVLDPWDKSYRLHDVFTDEEIAEIKSTKKKTLPQMPDELLKYLKSYKKATTFQQARDLIFTRQSWDQPFIREKSFDFDWIRSSIYNIVHELEAGDIDSEERSESWLIGRIWSVVDRAFDSLLHVKVTRGEKASTSSSARKNRDRIPQGRDQLERKKMGRRLDMIIRRKRVEVGGGEAGKEQSPNDAKMIRERDLKLPKALKDMMSALVVDVPSKVSTDIVITGILQYGLKMTVVLLDKPSTYICRITRTRTATVPDDITNIKLMRGVLYMAWSAKMLVQDSLKLLQTMEIQNNDDSSDDSDGDKDDLFTSVMEEPNDNNEELDVLPPCFTTPEKHDRIRAVCEEI